MTSKEQTAQPQTELIYGLHDNPPFGITLLASFQFILAMILGVMTPPAIVATALGAPAEAASYLISMSLLFAGLGTLAQAYKPFGIGSGMLNVQASSLAFPATLCSIGLAYMHSKGLPWDVTINTLLGACFVGSFWFIGGAYIIGHLRKIITHTVAGVTVLMIGLSLIKVGAIAMAGGLAAKETGEFGSMANLGLGALVILTVVVINCFRNRLFRMCSLALGMGFGFVVAACTGMVNWSILDQPRDLFVMPVPFKYGFFGFDWQAFILLSFLFLVVMIEAIGNLTATASVSELPTTGPAYRQRLKGGILCGGVFSAIGAVFGCFPMVTFAQNNGVIQLSGIASRKVGYYCGALFVLFALFPVVVVIFELLPLPVLGGTLVVLFGTIATSGIRILAEHGVNRRESIVISSSIGVGMVSMLLPEAFHQMPHFFQIFFDSPVVAGGVTAMIVHQILPIRKPQAQSGAEPENGEENEESLRDASAPEEKGEKTLTRKAPAREEENSAETAGGKFFAAPEPAGGVR